MLVMYSFYSEKKRLEKILYIKDCNFEPFYFLVKSVLLRREHWDSLSSNRFFCQYPSINYSALCVGNCEGKVRLLEPIIGPPPRKCSFCKEYTITSEDQGVSGKCSHVYHENCIVDWLNRGHNCCPLCKFDDGNKKTPLDLSKSLRERFPLGREMEFSDRICVIL